MQSMTPLLRLVLIQLVIVQLKFIIEDVSVGLFEPFLVEVIEHLVFLCINHPLLFVSIFSCYSSCPW